MCEREGETQREREIGRMNVCTHTCNAVPCVEARGQPVEGGSGDQTQVFRPNGKYLCPVSLLLAHSLLILTQFLSISQAYQNSMYSRLASNS